MYAVYVQIPSIKVDYSLVTHHGKNFELKGSTLWLMFVAFFKEMFLQEWPKKPNPCRSQFCNYMKLPLLKQHIPKAYSLSPCKPLVCSSFSTSSALVRKIISVVSLYLECIPLCRKTSAIRCYRRVTHGSLTCIKRYFYIPSQAWKKKWEYMKEKMRGHERDNLNLHCIALHRRKTTFKMILSWARKSCLQQALKLQECTNTPWGLSATALPKLPWAVQSPVQAQNWGGFIAPADVCLLYHVDSMQWSALLLQQVQGGN